MRITDGSLAGSIGSSLSGVHGIHTEGLNSLPLPFRRLMFLGNVFQRLIAH